MRNALNENTLFTITTGDESLPVVIGNNLRDLDDLLGKTFIRSAETEIPVGILMRQTMDTDLKQIVAGAEGDYYPLDLTPSTKDIPAVMATIRRCVADDDRFEVSFSGSYFSNRNMVGQLVGVLIVALLLLFGALKPYEPVKAASAASVVNPVSIVTVEQSAAAVR